MPHSQDLQRKNRVTCINYMLRAHEAYEAALAGDQARYQTLLRRLDSRSRAWLWYLVATRGADIPTPSLTSPEALHPLR